ncbi:MAG: hypothetical protein R2834_17870 [Rhodothermales bacterium]
MRYLVVFCLAFGVLTPAARAQSTLDDVHLLVNFLPDATVAPSAYLNGGLSYADYDFVSQTTIGGSVHIPFSRRFEGAAVLQYLNVDPDVGRNRDGLADILLNARYLLPTRNVQTAIGGYLTLPVGSDDIGAGDDVALGFFAAWRYGVGRNTALTATTGLDFVPIGDDYDLALRLGGGIIHRTSDRFAILGELYIRTVTDHVLLAGGFDYRVSPQGRLRGGLGLGLSDETADYTLSLSYLYNFRR